MFQSRCVGPYCPHREPVPVGADASVFLVNAWRAHSDCLTYDETPANVVGAFASGPVVASPLYTAFTGGRVITIHKAAYEVRLDSATGAVYELYNLRAADRINAIHANMGAALQMAFHDPTPIMTDVCGGGGDYWNPTQAGAYCAFTGGTVQHTILQPSATTTVYAAGNATVAATSAHQMMAWAYGPGFEGPYNAGDTATLQPTLTAFDDYFQIDTAFTNSGPEHKGFVETPAFYLTNGFRNYAIRPVPGAPIIAGTLPLIPAPGPGSSIPASSLTAPPVQSGVFYYDGDTRQVTLSHVDDPAQVYTLAWFYSPEIKADQTIAPSWQIGQTTFNVKFGTFQSFTARTGQTYRLRYAVFPYRTSDTIHFRGGTTTVAAAIEALRAEFETAGAPPPPPPPPPPSMAFDAAHAPESLTGWPASAAVDGNMGTDYSSLYFTSATPDRPVFLHGEWTAPRTISKITLTARMGQGAPIGFPALYNVYVAKEDDSGWDLVAGGLDWQPGAGGQVLVPIAPRTTRGVLVIPVTLGTDGYNFYFQLGELSAAP